MEVMHVHDVVVSISGATIIIGADGGLGRHLFLAEARAGHNVVAVGKDDASLQQTLALADEGQHLSSVVVDVTTAAGAAALGKAVAGAPVRAIVVVAGVSAQPAHVPEALQAEAVWTNALRQKLLSAVLPIEALLPQLMDSRGRIVLVGGTAGLYGEGGPYAAAEAALAGYGRDLALRTGPRGICANTLAVESSVPNSLRAARQTPQLTSSSEIQAQPSGSGLEDEAERVAAYVRWLLDGTGRVTGQTLTVGARDRARGDSLMVART
jgi:NAD(P)-dependent dehydrogenase (short-subunit alcohol dehydrogenase family)